MILDVRITANNVSLDISQSMIHPLVTMLNKEDQGVVWSFSYVGNIALTWDREVIIR